MGRGELEPERPHLVEVTHRAVGDGTGGAQRLVDVGLDLAPLRALPARLVEVVDDDHPRGGNRQDVIPPRERARAMAFDRLGLGPDDRGDGMTDQRAQLGEETADLGRHEALVAGPHVERLDGVGDARTRDLAERVDHIDLLM